MRFQQLEFVARGNHDKYIVEPHVGRKKLSTPWWGWWYGGIPQRQSGLTFHLQVQIARHSINRWAPVRKINVYCSLNKILGREG